MKISAIVTTCNEEHTIGPLVSVLAAAKPCGDFFQKITVVSSACKDRTDEIVRQLAAGNSRIELITEPTRRGKAAAINTGIKHLPADAEIILLSSGDVLPETGAVEALCEPFIDEKIGMTGGRPHPVNDSGSLLDQMAQLLWAMHHRVALLHPKLGELIVSRRKYFTPLPVETPVDEALIEARAIQHGARLFYVPEAVIRNRGPASLREWMLQRRRIASGHIWLKKVTGYTVATVSGSSVLRALVDEALPHPRRWLAAPVIVICEILAKILGRYDAAFGKNKHAVWTMAASTKQQSLETDKK